MSKPCQIPSAYYICDAFLYLDVLLRKRLFHPDPKQVETRQSLGASEAVKVKRCLQALRYLWRNAKGSSHDASVQSLKEHLCPSPLQHANNSLAAVPPESSDEEPEEDESPALEEEPPMSPGDVGFGGDIGGATLSDFENGESELEGDGDELVDPMNPKQGRVVQEASRVESDSDDSLNAPTLQLASQSSDNLQLDDEDLRDSQVPGAGWLGQFYSKYGRFGKDENSASFPKCVHEGDKQGMLDEILATLMRFDEEIYEHLCLCFQEN